MALTDDSKSELQGMVTTIRERLTKEFTKQLQGLYGIQPSGAITDVEDLGIVDEEQRTAAEQLRESIDHYASGAEASKKTRKEAIQRTIREQAFTILNRFAALRLAEERDLIAESVGNGFESAGFRVYDRVAGSDVGETTYERYRVYLECLFDELSRDLGVLFDRFAPEGLLFPREEALEDVLDALTDEAVDAAWTEDETIGWIYQYFHPKSERKGMRDESQQPRNSREMAVRNQLFTPRYVVEFLVDNSLGRYWHEMTQGDTDLTADLDYFVPRENELFLGEDEAPPQEADDDLYVAPHRPMKDPREIRLLDPACGSMHFGLYAFDLFEKMYVEAWDRYPDIRESLQADLGLEEGDREAFLREVPRLIVENNLYGVDIDRRAAQIAGLALWLRAQRSWSEQGVAPADRPRIRESGIVCAEPMPGEEDLLEAYVDKLEAQGPEGRLLGNLVEEIWDRMQIAGEAGPLLKIEREIEDVLETARRQFEERQERIRRKEGKQGVMFDDLKEPEQGELQFDVSGVEASFFEQAEELLLTALQDFAAESSEGTDSSRRLFADDAERGFDFLELMHRGATTGFDVVVMNPPFGDVSKGAKSYVDEQYPNTKNDVLEAFVERAEELLDHNGFMGAITKRTSFFLPRSGDWRKRIVLRKYHPLVFADLGYGVLDAKVETAAYVFRALSEDGQKALTYDLIPDLETVETTSDGKFSIPKYRRARGFDSNKRHFAETELKRLEEAGLIQEDSGRYTQYRHRWDAIRDAKTADLAGIPVPALGCHRIISSGVKDRKLRDPSRRSQELYYERQPYHFTSFPSASFV
jgi:type I restriction-modification system DNA methylase subunit